MASQKVARVFTGLAGLPVCKDPHRELLKIYGKVLRGLSQLPKESQYRIATEQLIMERKSIIETTPNPEDVEKKIGQGLCEEMIEQASQELSLIETMDKYKPWETMAEKPSQDQWKWPPL